MWGQPENPSVRAEDVFATSSRRLARARLTGRRVLQAKQSQRYLAGEVVEHTPQPPSMLAFGFDAILSYKRWAKPRGITHRRTDLGRAKRNAEAVVVGFVGWNIDELERQATTPHHRGRRLEAEKFGASIVATASLSQPIPRQTQWAIIIKNRRDEVTAIGVQTSNAETPGVNHANEQPKQRRAPYMELLDPTTLEPFDTPRNVTGRAALYRTVETTFALLAHAQDKGTLISAPARPVALELR